jgi:hypothetical protein
MVDEPVATPVTKPVLLTVATRVFELLQLPPVAASVSWVVAPPHTVKVPVIVPAVIEELTVTIFVAEALPQLFVTAYVIVAVPAETPVTIPVLPTVATPVAPELHTPPLTASLSVMGVLVQSMDAPEMLPAPGNAFTVITVVNVLPDTV